MILDRVSSFIQNDFSVYYSSTTAKYRYVGEADNELTERCSTFSEVVDFSGCSEQQVLVCKSDIIVRCTCVREQLT